MLSLPFSGATAAAIRTASWIAYQHSHNTTGPEHFLHGALEADGSRVNQLLRLASGESAFDLWHLIWPDGLRRPAATPPLNPLARAVIEYTTAEARIRGAALVTTGDLLRVLMRTNAPGLDRFFSALEVTADLLVEVETELDSLEQECLRASTRRGVILSPTVWPSPVERPTPGMLEVELTVESGPICAALLWAQQRKPTESLTTVDLLEATEAVDPIETYPARRLLEAAVAGGTEEPGRHTMMAAGESLRLSSAAAATVATAMRLSEVYGLQFVRHELTLAALLLVRDGAVRKAFERTLLSGLTTTRTHLAMITGLRLEDLPAVARQLNRTLRSELADDGLGPDVLVDLAVERWDASDADPLSIVDLLSFALSCEDPKPFDSVRLFAAEFDDGLPDEDQRVLPFRQLALLCRLLASVVIGDLASLPALYERIRAAAIVDRWTSRLERLRGWEARLEVLPWEGPPSGPQPVDELISCVSPDEVVAVVRTQSLWPTDELLDAVARAVSDPSVSNEFAVRGGVHDALVMIAAVGLDRAEAAAHSPRTAARFTMRRDEKFFGLAFTPAVFGQVMKDMSAKSGLGDADELLRSLEDAPKPLSMASFEKDSVRLALNASMAMGSEYEASYLNRFVLAKVLIAEKTDDPAEANAAAERALHAFKLNSLAGFSEPGTCAVSVGVLALWSQAAAALADRPGDLAEADLLALRTAVFAAADPEELEGVIAQLEDLRLGVARRWSDRAATVLTGRAPPRPTRGYQASFQVGAVARVGVERFSEAIDGMNEAVDLFRQKPSLATAEAAERKTAAALDLDVLSRDATMHSLARLAAVLNVADDDGIAVEALAERVTERCAAFAAATVEPGVGWQDFVNFWLDLVGRFDREKLFAAYETVLAVSARGFRDSRTYEERRKRGSELAVASERLAVELVREGEFERAATILEIGADLGRRDRRERWQPPPLAQSVKTIGHGPELSIGAQTGDPYLMALVERAEERTAPEDWLANRLAEVESAAWPASVRVLVVVPSRDGGAVLALEQGRWQGWLAPSLDHSAFRGQLSLLFADGENRREIDRQAAIADLAERLPSPALEWARSSQRLVLVPRGWLSVAPLHAVFAEGWKETAPVRSPVISHATSVASWTETSRANPISGDRPETLIVSNPRPSSMVDLHHAMWECGALSVDRDDLEVCEGTNATRSRVLDRLRAGPDLFHFAGHAGSGGLVLSYDVAVSVSDILWLDAPAPRLTVLSGCDTAVVGLHMDDTVSLVSAFQDTRCPAVLGNLWEVADLATALAMDAFYRELTRSGWEDIASALHRATSWLRSASRRACIERIEEIRAGNPRLPPWTAEQVPRLPKPYAHPTFWAPFIVYGP